jgi:hypothetical protein
MQIRPILERATYVAWLFFLGYGLASFIIVSQVGTLVCFVGGPFPSGLDDVLRGLLFVPLSVALRLVGVRFLHFREHEEAFEFTFPQSPVYHSLIYKALEFSDRIDAADPWTRQDIRREVKDWLLSVPRPPNPSLATLCRELFSYLLPDDWPRK